MSVTTTTPAVINATTDQHGWLAKVREAMENKLEVVLLILSLDDAAKSELSRLARQFGYSGPANPDPKRFEEFRPKLSLTGFAAKEQGITPNSVYVLTPQ